jgi:hypothetical protein
VDAWRFRGIMPWIKWSNFKSACHEEIERRKKLQEQKRKLEDVKKK